MNGVIRKELNHRYKLLKKAQKTTKGSKEWSDFKSQRNKCTNLIRKTVSNYWKEKFSNSNDVKSFWKTVRNFQGKNNSAKVGCLQTEDGTLLTDDYE